MTASRCSHGDAPVDILGHFAIVPQWQGVWHPIPAVVEGDGVVPWCPRRDSNPHRSPQQILSLSRIPFRHLDIFGYGELKERESGNQEHHSHPGLLFHEQVCYNGRILHCNRQFPMWCLLLGSDQQPIAYKAIALPIVLRRHFPAMFPWGGWIPQMYIVPCGGPCG